MYMSCLSTDSVLMYHVYISLLIYLCFTNPSNTRVYMLAGSLFFLPLTLASLCVDSHLYTYLQGARP